MLSFREPWDGRPWTTTALQSVRTVCVRWINRETALALSPGLGSVVDDHTLDLRPAGFDSLPRGASTHVMVHQTEITPLEKRAAVPFWRWSTLACSPPATRFAPSLTPDR